MNISERAEIDRGGCKLVSIKKSTIRTENLFKNKEKNSHSRIYFKERKWSNNRVLDALGFQIAHGTRTGQEAKILRIASLGCPLC